MPRNANAHFYRTVANRIMDQTTIWPEEYLEETPENLFSLVKWVDTDLRNVETFDMFKLKTTYKTGLLQGRILTIHDDEPIPDIERIKKNVKIIEWEIVPPKPGILLINILSELDAVSEGTTDAVLRHLRVDTDAQISNHHGLTTVGKSNNNASEHNRTLIFPGVSNNIQLTLSEVLSLLEEPMKKILKDYHDNMVQDGLFEAEALRTLGLRDDLDQSFLNTAEGWLSRVVVGGTRLSHTEKRIVQLWAAAIYMKVTLYAQKWDAVKGLAPGDERYDPKLVHSRHFHGIPHMLQTNDTGLLHKTHADMMQMLSKLLMPFTQPGRYSEQSVVSLETWAHQVFSKVKFGVNLDHAMRKTFADDMKVCMLQCKDDADTSSVRRLLTGLVDDGWDENGPKDGCVDTIFSLNAQDRQARKTATTCMSNLIMVVEHDIDVAHWVLRNDGGKDDAERTILRDFSEFSKLLEYCKDDIERKLREYIVPNMHVRLFGQSGDEDHGGFYKKYFPMLEMYSNGVYHNSIDTTIDKIWTSQQKRDGKRFIVMYNCNITQLPKLIDLRGLRHSMVLDEAAESQKQVHDVTSVDEASKSDVTIELYRLITGLKPQIMECVDATPEPLIGNFHYFDRVKKFERVAHRSYDKITVTTVDNVDCDFEQIKRFASSMATVLLGNGVGKPLVEDIASNENGTVPIVLGNKLCHTCIVRTSAGCGSMQIRHDIAGVWGMHLSQCTDPRVYDSLYIVHYADGVMHLHDTGNPLHHRFIEFAHTHLGANIQFIGLSGDIRMSSKNDNGSRRSLFDINRASYHIGGEYTNSRLENNLHDALLAFAWTGRDPPPEDGPAMWVWNVYRGLYDAVISPLMSDIAAGITEGASATIDQLIGTLPTDRADRTDSYNQTLEYLQQQCRKKMGRSIVIGGALPTGIVTTDMLEEILMRGDHSLFFHWESCLNLSLKVKELSKNVFAPIMSRTRPNSFIADDALKQSLHDFKRLMDMRYTTMVSGIRDVVRSHRVYEFRNWTHGKMFYAAQLFAKYEHAAPIKLVNFPRGNMGRGTTLEAFTEDSGSFWQHVLAYFRTRDTANPEKTASSLNHGAKVSVQVFHNIKGNTMQSTCQMDRSASCMPTKESFFEDKSCMITTDTDCLHFQNAFSHNKEVIDIVAERGYMYKKPLSTKANGKIFGNANEQRVAFPQLTDAGTIDEVLARNNMRKYKRPPPDTVPEEGDPASQRARVSEEGNPEISEGAIQAAFDKSKRLYISKGKNTFKAQMFGVFVICTLYSEMMQCSDGFTWSQVSDRYNTSWKPEIGNFLARNNVKWGAFGPRNVMGRITLGASRDFGRDMKTLHRQGLFTRDSTGMYKLADAN